MILGDNKSVQGIFVYTELAEYEKGDFVVDEDCIYICTAKNPTNRINNTVQGIRPSTPNPEYPNNFISYPGSLIESLEGYKEYIQNPTIGGDKYISSKVLSGVLQQAYFGFNDTGVITDYVRLCYYKSETTYSGIVGIEERPGMSGSVGLSGSIGLEEKTTYIPITNENVEIKYLANGIEGTIVDPKTKVLDILLMEDTLNNGCLKVSGNLPEFSDELFKIAPSGLDKILRQYTYVDNSDSTKTNLDGTIIYYRYRIQELIDIENKQIYYRYVKGVKTGHNDWSYSKNTPSKWYATIENKELLDKVNNIIDYYEGERVEAESKKNNNFRLSSLTINEETNNLTLVGKESTSSGENIVKLPIDIKSDSTHDTPIDIHFLITILVKVKLANSNSLYKNYETTIDLKDIPFVAGSTINEISYKLDNDVILNLSFERSIDSSELFIRMKIETTNLQNEYILLNDAVIKDIYYRKDSLDE